MRKLPLYIILLICGIIMVIPFVWMVTTALKPQIEVNNGNVGFIPMEEFDEFDNGTEQVKIKILKEDGDSTFVHFFDAEGKIKRAFAKVQANKISHKKVFKLYWSNFRKAFKKVPFGRYFLNTIFVSIFVMIGVIITSSLAAYAFARMRFFGKDFLFYLFVSMMMVPQPIYLIPSYVLMSNLGWIDTYSALIVPWIANIFTIFLLRQHFKTIPQDLFDAAAIDGCSRFRMLWQIVLPLSKSVISTAAIFSIIGSWNSFMCNFSL